MLSLPISGIKARRRVTAVIVAKAAAPYTNGHGLAASPNGMPFRLERGSFLFIGKALIKACGLIGSMPQRKSRQLVCNSSLSLPDVHSETG
jgi:hypothetical protein